MFVRGIDLGEVREVERGDLGVRVTFVNGDRQFVEGEKGVEVWNAWALERRLKDGGGDDRIT